MGGSPSEGVAAAARRATEIVFVCSGNMVRSAFAELYARHLDCPTPVRSVATTYRNDSLFPETALALRTRGVDASWIAAFLPTHVDDLVPPIAGGAALLVMTRSHLADLSRRRDLPAAHLLGGLIGLEEIPDPVLEGAEFQETFTKVGACVEALVELLRSGARSRA